MFSWQFGHETPTQLLFLWTGPRLWLTASVTAGQSSRHWLLKPRLTVLYSGNTGSTSAGLQGPSCPLLWGGDTPTSDPPSWTEFAAVGWTGWEPTLWLVGPAGLSVCEEKRPEPWPGSQSNVWTRSGRLNPQQHMWCPQPIKEEGVAQDIVCGMTGSCENINLTTNREN